MTRDLLPGQSSLTPGGLLLMLVVSQSAGAQSGGVSLEQTRVVFAAADKAQTVTINNTSGQAYLIQSRVLRDLHKDAAAPFIVTPPLFALKANSRQLLRVLPQGATLPAERESLFYLSVLAIPAQTNGEYTDSDQTRLSMGFRFVIKLFYRPAGLTLSPEATACQLQFSRDDQGVLISNPTPYFQTFGRLALNHSTVKLKAQSLMVAPLSTQHYTMAGPLRDATWQTITDYGGLSQPCQQTVATKKVTTP